MIVAYPPKGTTVAGGEEKVEGKTDELMGTVDAYLDKKLGKVEAAA